MAAWQSVGLSGFRIGPVDPEAVLATSRMSFQMTRHTLQTVRALQELPGSAMQSGTSYRPSRAPEDTTVHPLRSHSGAAVHPGRPRTRLQRVAVAGPSGRLHRPRRWAPRLSLRRTFGADGGFVRS